MQRQSANSPSNKGMTLIEVVISISIFTIAILATMSAVFSAMATNRILTANVAADSAILAQKEEVFVAASGSKTFSSSGERPKAALAWFLTDPQTGKVNLDMIGKTDGGHGIPVGPNREALPKLRLLENVGLVYTFDIPGLSGVDVKGEPYDKGYGEMTIYLNENAVPEGEGIAIHWDDLGDNAGKTAQAVEASGKYAIYGDDQTRNRMSGLSVAKLRDLFNHPDEYAIVSLPIDITIRYFTEPSQERLYYDTTRRVVVTGLSGGYGANYYE